MTVCDSSNIIIITYIFHIGNNLMFTTPVLSVSQVHALKNYRGKADINFWIYLVMFKIVLYSTIQLHCIVTHTILTTLHEHCSFTLHNTTRGLTLVWGKKSPVLQSQYWAFFANPCITGKIPFYGAVNKSGVINKSFILWWKKDSSTNRGNI